MYSANIAWKKMKNKKIKILFIFFFLFLVFLPLISNAQPLIGSYITNALKGIEHPARFAYTLYLVLAFSLLFTYIFLGASAYLLQGAILTPIDLNNSLVWSGWTFTLGLANTFFILIAIIIALSYILKIETIAQKKILVNLILIALLVNFSLLFVKAMADIGNILSNSLLLGEQNLVSKALSGMTANILVVVIAMAGTIAGQLPFLVLPLAGVVTKYIFTFLILSVPLFGPLLVQWILMIIFGLALAFSISSLLNMLMLLAVLRIQVGDLDDKRIIESVWRIILASMVMGVIIHGMKYLIAPLVDMHTFIGIFVQASVSTFLGCLVYLLIAIYFNFSEVNMVCDWFKKAKQQIINGNGKK